MMKLSNSKVLGRLATVIVVFGMMAGCGTVQNVEVNHPPPTVEPVLQSTIFRGVLGRACDEAVMQATKGKFWGAVLVAKGGEVVLAKGYGYADYHHVPNLASTFFEIASTSKQFTAAGILKLQMEKKLQLNDPITSFFEHVPPDKRAITVHQLLTHTSGLDPRKGLPYASPLSRNDFVKFILKHPMTSMPGEKFEYNNAGYALLAAIIEVASERSFENYMKEKIFKPAGMADTGFVKDGDLASERASTRLKGRLPNATCLNWFWSWGYRGMGGVVTTVLDLHKWDRVLRSDKVLNAKAREALFKPFKDGYALGWKVSATSRGTTKVSHSGNVVGFTTQLTRYIEDDAFIAILTNGKTEMFNVERRIDGLLFEKPKIVANIDTGPFKLNKWKYLTLAGDVTWNVEKKGKTITLVLVHRASKHALARIHVPAGIAKKLKYELGTLLEAKESSFVKAPDVSEGGVYLQTYDVRKGRVEISGDIRIKLRPNYKVIVDERITFVLERPRIGSPIIDSPIMVKMSHDESRRLLNKLKKLFK